MYKISVIIPIFNAETTIESAIDSVINQTIGFENIELILVDDDSNDNSKKIIQNYAAKYNNIKPIFLQQNTGSPSKPRNIGIDNATSPYLMFLDNDDEFVEDYCETVYNIITQEQVDIVNTSYCRRFISGYYAFDDSDKSQKIVDDPLSLRFTIWGNIFRIDFIKKNKIYFPDSLYEDGVFCIKSFTKADNIIQLPKYVGYIYTVEREGDTSITHNTKKETVLSFIEGYYHSNDYLTKNNFDKTHLISDIPMIYFMFFKFKGTINDKKDILREIHNFEKALNENIVLNSKILNLLNNLVLNERYSLTIFLSFFASRLYNNRSIKNFIFRRYSNLKKIEL